MTNPNKLLVDYLYVWSLALLIFSIRDVVIESIPVLPSLLRKQESSAFDFSIKSHWIPAFAGMTNPNKLLVDYFMSGV